MFHSLMQELRHQGSVRFYVRARPGAAVTRVLGKMDDASIKISIAAPPESGKANTELIRFLAEKFAVPPSGVWIVSGQTARMKLVQISR